MRKIILVILSAGFCFISAAETEYSDDFKSDINNILSISKASDYVAEYNLKSVDVNKESVLKKFSRYESANPVMEKTNSSDSVNYFEDEEISFVKKGTVRYSVSKLSGNEQLIDFARFAIGNYGKKSSLTKNDASINAMDYVINYLKIDKKDFAFENVKEMITQVYDEKLNVVMKSSDGFTVFYRRKLSDLVSAGSGGRITVYLSPEGEVVGHTLQWRDLEFSKYSEKSFYPADEVAKFAESELKSLPNKASFRSIKLGYYFYGSRTFQENIFPVYQIIYTLEGSSTYREKLYNAITGNKFVPSDYVKKHE